MKTFAALGLLLFSGALVVSGAMMGSLAAGQEADAPATPRVLGPCEIRVYVHGPDGKAWPRDRMSDPAVLVEPVTAPSADPAAPRGHPVPPPGERLDRQLGLEWVGAREEERRDDDRRKDASREPRGPERRSDAGHAARVVVIEHDRLDDERRRDDRGGYWRALYTPPAGRRIVGFGTTVIFKDEGLTRTISGFTYPTADATRDGEQGDAGRHLEAVERAVRAGAWDDARRRLDAFERAADAREAKGLREDARELRSAIDGREEARALKNVAELREALRDARPAK